MCDCEVCFPGGFLYVDEVLSLQQLRGFSEDDVRRVVETNEKQRFALEPHPDTGRLRIRANQGHSLQVSEGWEARQAHIGSSPDPNFPRETDKTASDRRTRRKIATICGALGDP